jgi:hypothetical protein
VIKRSSAGDPQRRGKFAVLPEPLQATLDRASASSSTVARQRGAGRAQLPPPQSSGHRRSGASGEPPRPYIRLQTRLTGDFAKRPLQGGKVVQLGGQVPDQFTGAGDGDAPSGHPSSSIMASKR